jgi:fructosamine-3-kinase
MSAALHRKLSQLLGTKVLRSTAAVGGDANQAFEVELEGGRLVFVKTQTLPLPGLYRCEAEGLEWLKAAKVLRVPEVLSFSEADELGPACLVLERVKHGRRDRQYDERLGAGLAALHRTGAERWGFVHNNYLAILPQNNLKTETWAEFYATRRIEPQLARAVDAGHISQPLRQRIEKALTRIAALVGPDEAPARLHGDLWAGNVLCDEHGAPVLIDPAVYGGHREVDLAMMRLFGGFSERVFAAYAEVYPLSDGTKERVPLYQLYPLLVHVNLFGAPYVPQVERCIADWPAAR